MRFLAALLALILGCLMLLHFCAPTRAHEAMQGWKYPFECCHNLDCAELTPDRVKAVAGGYMIDGKFHVPQKDVRWSPDGRYHGCFPKPDKLRCFFAPPMGF